VDEHLLKESNSFSLNKKHAITVRLGEKKILEGVLESVREQMNRTDEKVKGSKRKVGEGGSGVTKRSKLDSH
jgi:small nuclear ribonucleoprotein (snRNP)-like protein